MVAFRSPKPCVWVRILVLLPHNLKGTKLRKESMFSVFFRFLKIFFIFIIIGNILIVPFLCNHDSYLESTSISSLSDYIWPIPGYTNISSYFGYRNSPTSGASSYHSGLDIPAPEGTNIYAIDNGSVIFASWGAGGGYTITLSLSNNIKVSYCHLSPIMYVNKGFNVNKGDLIGTVGPKNVYGINNNPYKDKNGNPTNGATTGCHLHFTIKQNGKAMDPLQFYSE